MRYVLVLIGLLLVSCSMEQMNDKLSSPEDRGLALQTIAALRAGNLDPVKASMDPQLFAQSVPMLAKIAPVLAVPGMPRLVTVNVTTMGVGGKSATYRNLNYEVGGGNRWLVMQIQIGHAAGRIMVTGWHAEQSPVQPTAAGNFDFARKGAIHYFWLIAMLASTGTIIVAVVQAFRSRGIKRRWLWIIGSLFGLGRMMLNWATGEWTVQPIGLELLGGGFMRASPFSPWVLSFSLPIVAVIFLLRRKALLTPPEADDFA